MEALNRACKAMGSQKALADAIGKDQSTVSVWFRRKRVPALAVLKIEQVSGVPRHELRPDLYPVDR